RRWTARDRVAGLRDAFGRRASETLRTTLSDLTVSLKFVRDAERHRDALDRGAVFARFRLLGLAELVEAVAALAADAVGPGALAVRRRLVERGLEFVAGGHVRDHPGHLRITLQPGSGIAGLKTLHLLV